MEPSLIDSFIATCRKNGSKAAFVCDSRVISFEQLLSDMYRMADLIRSRGLLPGDRALILVPPSYDFYLLMLAGICCGIDLVAMDSYRDMGRIRKVLEENRIQWVFCTGLTALLKPALGTGLRFLSVEKYPAFRPSPCPYDTDPDRTVLTTFTSGTTGQPKPIFRSRADLMRQIRIISENITFDKAQIVFSKLPIYALFVVFNGLTCVISRKIRPDRLEKQGVTAILAPIADLLAIREPLPFIRQVSIGGAMLYPREVHRLRATFPQGDITYIYGSSECVLMAKGDLKAFGQTGALCTDISGVELSLVNTDQNGVGQICVRGEVVLTESKEQVSNDLGYLDAEGLHIVGRKNFSQEGRYNYLMDIELLEENQGVKKGFSLVWDGDVWFCYEGELSRKRADIRYLPFRTLPMDQKHKTKLDYHKALQAVQKAQRRSRL